MNRRTLLPLAVLALSACGEREQMPPDLFPEAAAGGWRRTAAADLPVSEAPDPVPRTAVERLRVAAYDGPGLLQARVYQLNSASVGGALAQRWRPSADTVFFNQGRFFVVVKWQSADRAALRVFVTALERKLAPRKR